MEATLNTAQLLKATGLTSSKIRYWKREGWLVPVDQGASPNEAQWSLTTLTLLRVMDAVLPLLRPVADVQRVVDAAILQIEEDPDRTRFEFRHPDRNIIVIHELQPAEGVHLSQLCSAGRVAALLSPFAPSAMHQRFVLRDIAAFPLDAQTKAKSARVAFANRRGPVDNLYKLFSEAGVVIVDAIGLNPSAVWVADDDRTGGCWPVMSVDLSNAESAVRMDMTEALGRLLCETEKEAQVFARAFLMPDAEDFAEANPDAQIIEHLAARYGCPPVQVARRARDLGHLYKRWKKASAVATVSGHSLLGRNISANVLTTLQNRSGKTVQEISAKTDIGCKQISMLL